MLGFPCRVPSPSGRLNGLIACPDFKACPLDSVFKCSIVISEQLALVAFAYTQKTALGEKSTVSITLLAYATNNLWQLCKLDLP